MELRNVKEQYNYLKKNVECNQVNVSSNEPIVHVLLSPKINYKITESVIHLGFKNQGNSCYIDLALQMLCLLPHFLSELKNHPLSNPLQM